MDEVQPVVFVKGRFVFRKSQTTPNFWLYQSIEFVTNDISRKVTIKRCSADNNLRIEIIITEFDKGVLLRIESFYHKGS